MHATDISESTSPESLYSVQYRFIDPFDGTYEMREEMRVAAAGDEEAVKKKAKLLLGELYPDISCIHIDRIALMHFPE